MVLHRFASLLSVALVFSVGATVGATGPDPSAGTLPGGGPAFGDYRLVPLLSGAARYRGPATPHTLTDVAIAGDVEQVLSDPATMRALLRNGFVIVPTDAPRFSYLYESQAYTGAPVFLTTDAAYDAWHLVFDRVLRSVEKDELLPRLNDLVGGMLANARTQAAELAGSPLSDPADRTVALLEVAGSVLRLKTGPAGDLARAELALIDAHEDLVPSPILGTDVDYSLFTPRGHYTRSKALTRYFRGMSVLGQMGFALPDAIQRDSSQAGVDGVRLAALASRTLVGDADLERLWREIQEPTAFLVGLSDDYSPFELAAAIESELPGAMTDPITLADDAAAMAVAARLVASRPVRIDPEKPSVRLMGTRFVLDAWIMDELLAPNVGTQADPRLLASPLDLAAAFGSAFAYGIQRAAGETAYEGYDSQLAALRDVIAARPDRAWGRTVYDAWLAAIEPMWLPRGAAFPDFMRGKAWRAKAHQTGFGSYTELKHDTVLYTKQFMGELGGDGPDEVPRNWVEPDPVPFARLQAVAELTREGLVARGLLTDKLDDLLADYRRLAGFLARIAADELAGRPIGKADNARLLRVGGTLEDIWWRSSDLPPDRMPALDEMAAVVADIGAGLDRVTDTVTVVEVGTGYIDQILVLVPDDRGRFHVAKGGVYSYYEFHQPIAERLSDEAWRSMLAAGDAPPRPDWIGLAMP